MNTLITDKNIKTNKSNLFICDVAYDSNNIREKLNEFNLGNLLAIKNKRNSKNKNLLKQKKILKKRFIIEHTNNNLKQFKRLNIRYDKYSQHFFKVYLFKCIYFNSKKK